MPPSPSLMNGISSTMICSSLPLSSLSRESCTSTRTRSATPSPPRLSTSTSSIPAVTSSKRALKSPTCRWSPTGSSIWISFDPLFRHNIIVLHLSHKIKQLGCRSIGHQISPKVMVLKPHIGLIRLPGPIRGSNPKLEQLLHLAPALRSHPFGDTFIMLSISRVWERAWMREFEDCTRNSKGMKDWVRDSELGELAIGLHQFSL